MRIDHRAAPTAPPTSSSTATAPSPAPTTSWSRRAATTRAARARSSRSMLANMTRRRVRALARRSPSWRCSAGRDVLGLLRPARHREDLPVLPGAARDRRRPTGRGSSAGLEQRLRALQLFLDDIYGEQRDPRRRASIPPELVLGAKHYLPQAARHASRRAACASTSRASISIRGPDGVLRVLEDNLRTPSGVSYVLENRLITKRMFPRALERARRPPRRRLPDPAGRDAALGVAGRSRASRRVVVLTPGPVQLGLLRAQLPRAHDGHRAGRGVRPVRRRRQGLRAHDARPAARRTSSTAASTTPSSIPEFFRPDSMLGVPGLMRAYAAGNVALANAPGNGVADDKAIYPFVPDMIRYYLGEEPILEQVATYVCARRDDRAVRARAPRRAGGQGGRRGGRLRHADGPAVDRRRARRVPRAASSPSRAATSRSTASSCRPARPGSPTSGALEPRRVDLRPYILTGTRRAAGCCPAG